MAKAKDSQEVRDVSNSPVRAALYCRVSTDEQAREGMSLTAQRERLTAFCVSQGWEIANTYIDDGYSGKDLNRPALTRVLADAREGQMDVLLVWKLDRLSRRQRDVLHLVEDEFGTAGVGLRSITESFDTTSPAGKAMLGMLSVFAQLERETLIQRVRLGKEQSAKQGRWFGGTPPYGYRLPKGAHVLEPDPNTAPVVAMIFRWFTRERWGLAKLCMELNRLGIRPALGTRWGVRSVGQVLDNVTYTGIIRQRSVHHQGQHPALVDRETWAATRALRDERRHFGHRDTGTYLLSTVPAFCGFCGSRIQGHAQKRPGRESDLYYACSGRYHDKSRGPRIACAFGTVRRDRVERWLLQGLQRFAFDDEELTRITTAALAFASETEHDRYTALTALRKQAASLEARLARWYDAFEQGALDPTSLRERTAALRSEKEETDQAIAALQRDASPADARIAVLESTIERLKQLANVLAEMPRDELTSLLPSVVGRVVVHRDHLDIVLWGQETAATAITPRP